MKLKWFTLIFEDRSGSITFDWQEACDAERAAEKAHANGGIYFLHYVFEGKLTSLVEPDYYEKGE